MLSLILMLMLLAHACAEPLTALYAGDWEIGSYAMMLETDGTALTPRDTYGAIYALPTASGGNSGALFMATEATPDYSGIDDPYMEPMRFALMDDSGKLLTGFDYLTFTHYPGEHLAVFTGLDNMDGVMDESGNIIMAAKYIDVRPNGRGGYLALDPGGAAYDYNIEYPVVYIDEKGRSFDTGYTARPYCLGRFSGGYCALYNDEGYIYLDFEGTDVFGRRFATAEAFQSGCAVVQDMENGLFGLFGADGEYILDPAYRSIAACASETPEVFLASGEHEALIIDGKTLSARGRIDLDAYGITYLWLLNDRFIAATGMNEYFVFDFDGSLRIRSETSVDLWYLFSDSQPERAVISEGEWPDGVLYLADLDGNPASPAFQSLIPVSWQNGQGRYIFCTFDMLTSPDGYRFPDWNSYRYGLCDQDGNILLEPIFTALDALSPERYWARLGPRYGMIDEAGKWYYAIDDYAYLMD